MTLQEFFQQFQTVLRNDVLWVSIFASTLAQFFKPFTYWRKTGEFDWHHISATGGMPSSHSALVSCLAMGVGIEHGFDSALFAISVILAMVVVYDAQGVRREAGEHAWAINSIIAELLSGHPIDTIRFKEVLGHSKWEVAIGIIFGVGLMITWKLAIQPVFL